MKRAIHEKKHKRIMNEPSIIDFAQILPSILTGMAGALLGIMLSLEFARNRIRHIYERDIQFAHGLQEENQREIIALRARVLELQDEINRLKMQIAELSAENSGLRRTIEIISRIYGGETDD